MESGISKGSASQGAKSHRSGSRTCGFYDEERERGEQLSPLEREWLRMSARERYAKHINELTPRQRERLRTITRERYAASTPLQRERLRRFAQERYAELTPFERKQLRRFIRERYHGPYGRAQR
jgi:hypothetical protein